MGRIAGIRRWLHLDREVVEEIEEELELYFEEASEELIAKGMTPEAARAEAHRRFGNLTRYREELRVIDEDLRATRDRFAQLEDFTRVVGQGWRSIWRRPGFTILVTVMLGLGIGVNAAMFGVLDRLMLQPPALVRDPDAVRRLYVKRSFLGRETINSSLSYSDIKDFQKSPLVSGFAAVRKGSFSYGQGVATRDLPVNLVTPGFFELLGVTPALGRFLIPSDDSAATGSGAVVLSHAFWQSEFGGDRQVLGRTLEIGDGRYQVAGVAPRGFNGISPQRVDLWLSLRPSAFQMIAGPWEESRGFHWLNGIVRLAPGMSLEQAQAQATVAHRAAYADDKRYDPKAELLLGPLLEARGPDSPPETKVSLWVAGVSIAVLLVACANVANLLLFRAIRRRRETAVRLALGIGRRRLIGELMVETMMLALVAGIGGSLLAAWGGDVIRHLLVPSMAVTGPSMTWRVAVFSILISLSAGIFAGIVPAMLESRPDLLASLKLGGAQGGSRRSLLRSGLVVIQAGLSVALLVGAGLFLVSFSRVRSMDLGIKPENLLLVSLNFPRDTKAERRLQVYSAAVERINGMPGIKSAAYTTGIPFRTSWSEDLKIPGIDSIPTVRTGGPYVDRVSPDYFPTMGIQIIKGRGFTVEDRLGSARVAVVGETMARLIWQSEDALGKCMKIGGDTMPCSEVVGVARDAQRNSFVSGERMQYYIPFAQMAEGAWPGGLFLRTVGDPLTVMGPVRAALMEIAPDLRLVELESMEEVISPEYRSWELGATLFTAFGALALLVSAIGLYSLLSYGVASRIQEIGVRSALGARPAELITLVAKDGLALVTTGLGVGLVAAILVAGSMQSLLFQTSPREPGVYLAVVGVLLLIALVSGAIPAWRATRVSPMRALRAD